MKRVITTMTRAGAHGTTSLLTRAAMTLLMVLTTASAWAQTEGPWTYYSHRWGSIYTHTENVPAYTRKVLIWNYELRAKSDHYQTTALYARDNLDALQSTWVDFTERYTDGSGSQYLLSRMTQTWAGTNTDAFTRSFWFDNRSSGSAKNMTVALLLTHVIGNSGSGRSVHQWAGFKNISYSWENYYYKYITFNSNGGSGSMSKQTIENSGNLQANTLTRNGYYFSGWNTKSDGSGTAYADKATIIANSDQKGNVELYAQWVKIADDLQANFSQAERKVTLTWKVKKGLPNGTFYIYRNGTQISSQLVNVMYILDEPSIGLHQRDNHFLIDSLRSLRDMGNSVIVVEHDRDMMKAADYIVDVGPAAGEYGGEIVAAGTYKEILKSSSLTAAYLKGKKKIKVPKVRRKGNGEWLSVIGATGNNLKNVTVEFPLGTLISTRLSTSTSNPSGARRGRILRRTWACSTTSANFSPRCPRPRFGGTSPDGSPSMCRAAAAKSARVRA